MSLTAIRQAPTIDQQMLPEVLTPAATSLSAVTFVVVDLETTGGSARQHAITEIGAVKVRGGQVLGEFATLVNPRQPIPAFIQALTGISNADVAPAPGIGAVLPSFLEFASGAVLVAHNARFDVSFLRAASSQEGLDWPAPPILDTVHLARQLVTREEVRNHRLGSLATFFGATTEPNHRALSDARATVDVLHGLLARVGSLGVTSWEELRDYSRRVPAARRRRRHLADGLPHAPGVYLFEDAAGCPLYIGTSVDVRTRVLQYFTNSETRPRMGDMVAQAARVRAIPCPTPVEAQVREIRLIAHHKPIYNRRSRNPGRATWVRLTAEAYPRLSVVASVRADQSTYAGPFNTRAQATAAVEAIHEAIPLRQCSTNLAARPRVARSACALADLGRCPAPCTGGVDIAQYRQIADQVQRLLSGATCEVPQRITQRLQDLAQQQRYELAATVRDRSASLLQGLARSQRAQSLALAKELVAARAWPGGGWELICVRRARLAGSTVTPHGADPWPYVRALQASSEAVWDDAGAAACAEETRLLVHWLEQPGVRIVHLDGSWHSPVAAAARFAPSFSPPPVAKAQQLDSNERG